MAREGVLSLYYCCCCQCDSAGKSMLTKEKLARTDVNAPVVVVAVVVICVGAVVIEPRLLLLGPEETVDGYAVDNDCGEDSAVEVLEVHWQTAMWLVLPSVGDDDYVVVGSVDAPVDGGDED